MERTGTVPAPPTTGPSSAAGTARAAVPGLAAAVAVAVPAWAAGQLLPVVGAPVFAVLAGILTGVLLRGLAPSGLRERLRPGLSAAGQQVLQTSVVLLGTQLSLRQVAAEGVHSLPVMLGTLAVALLGARLAGRSLRVPDETRMLIGVGTGICGASAIAAVTAVVGAEESSVAYALATIFTFNIAAVLAFPFLGHLLGMSPSAFGLWSGTAVNDTSSVVAAARAYGSTAVNSAVVVKLTRSLMIVPVCLALQSRCRPRGRAGQREAVARTGRAVPLFILGFLAASAIATAGWLPAGWRSGLSSASAFLVTVALAGIGLSVVPGQLRRAGARPLALGAILWAAVAVSSLALQALTGAL